MAPRAVFWRAILFFFSRPLTAPALLLSLNPRAAQSEFIIIACDGIWDVLEDQEAVDMVRGYLRANPQLPPSVGKDLAHILIEASLAKGSSDNVTACVVLL